MKKNVLKALFVGMVLSASLGVEAQWVTMADIPNMQAISRNRNPKLKEKVQALLNKMNERSELDWTGMCGLINSAVSSGYIGQRWAAVDALLPEIEHIIRTAAAPVSSAPQPAAPDPATVAAAAAAAAAHEEQEARKKAEEEARQRQEAAINDLTSSILDRIEGLPGEKEIWISALEKILSISDLNRKIEALTDLKLKLEIFIATAAAAPVAEEIFFRQQFRLQQEVAQAARRLAEKQEMLHAVQRHMFEQIQQQRLQQLQDQLYSLRAPAAAAAAYSPDVAHTPTPYKDAPCDNSMVRRIERSFFGD